MSFVLLILAPYDALSSDLFFDERGETFTDMGYKFLQLCPVNCHQLRLKIIWNKEGNYCPLDS